MEIDFPDQLIDNRSEGGIFGMFRDIPAGYSGDIIPFNCIELPVMMISSKLIFRSQLMLRQAQHERNI
ncbi:MAG: hypothetical protein WCK00_09115, partial [Deltaproteobacteria bacterium]